MKKFLMVLIMFIFVGIGIYQYQNRTVECWWGVIYPQLSFISFEDEEFEEETKFSALDKDYMPLIISNQKEIKYKWFILEWWKKKLGQIAQ